MLVDVDFWYEIIAFGFYRCYVGVGGDCAFAYTVVQDVRLDRLRSVLEVRRFPT